MKKKESLGIVLTLVAAGVGFGVGPYVLGDSKDAGKTVSEGDQSLLIEENKKLVKTLADLKAKIQKLQSEGEATALPEIVKPKKTGDPAKDALNEELYKLRKELEILKKEGPKLSAEEIQAKLSELNSAFDSAVAGKVGKEALAAMRGVGKLGEPGFVDLLRMWKTMEENEWLDVERQSRRGWGGDKAFFHWALTNNVNLDDKLLAKFQSTGIFALRFLENNKEKLAATFVSLLGKLDLPKNLEEKKEENPGAGPRGRGGRGGRGPGRGRGGRGGRNQDPYRSALRELSRIKNPSAATMLVSVYSNTALPEDVRNSALRGLLNQPTEDAKRVIREAVNDPSEKLSETATKLNELVSAKVTGYYVRSVKKGSVAEKAGIQPGSSIISYAGRVITSDRELWFLPRTQKTKTAVVVVYHNEATLNLTVETNKDLGVDGTYVKVLAKKESE